MKITRLRSDETCLECGELATSAIELGLPASLPLEFCDRCIAQLGHLVKARRRRGLSPRVRAGVRALKEAGPSGLTEEELKAKIGPYATNVLKSLSARGLMARLESGRYVQAGA